MRFHKIANVNKALDFIASKGVKLVSIGAEGQSGKLLCCEMGGGHSRQWSFSIQKVIGFHRFVMVGFAQIDTLFSMKLTLNFPAKVIKFKPCAQNTRRRFLLLAV
jgi:hypothetical protein